MDSPSNIELLINQKTLIENYQILNESRPHCQHAAVLKANAYGLGIENVAPALVKAGCRLFFVATLSEGIDLRNLLPDIEIVVLHGCQAEQTPLFLQHKLIPMLITREQVVNWPHQRACALKLNTGMNRLGLDEADLALLTKEQVLQKLNLHSIHSHLSSKGSLNDKFTEQQINLFKNLLSNYFKNVPSGIFNSQYYNFQQSENHEIIRHGLNLLGVNKQNPLPLKNVFRLRARLIQMRTLSANEPIGYNKTFHTQQASLIGTAAIGYADGLVDGSYDFYYKDQACPIVGTMSMDLTTVDLSALKSNPPQEGDWLDVITENVPFYKTLNACNKTAHQFLVGLGTRCKRIRV